MIPCKLQMMRSQPVARLGTMMAAGLTLKHYKSFQNCPTHPALIQRLNRELPAYDRFGIHVLVSQTENGQVTIGDSHEYGDAITPFDQAIIDTYILNYLKRFLVMLDLEIVERWHGIYVKHPTQPYVTAKPRANVVAVTGVGGAGMTLSFGLAERIVQEFMGESS